MLPVRVLLQRRVEPVVERPAEADAVPRRGTAAPRWKRQRSGSGTGLRNCSNGAAQCGERWKIVSDATRSWISGPNCIALAPLPMTATRLPARSRSFGHAAVWKDGAGEAVEALDVRELQRVEDADGADHDVGDGACSPAAVGPRTVDVPALRVGVVLRRARPRVPKRMCAAQAEAVGDVLEVGVQLVAQGEVHRPVVGRERERVEVVGRVDAGARVAVLPPGAAHGGRSSRSIGEGDASLLEVHRRADAGHAAADDQHLGSPSGTSTAARRRPGRGGGRTGRRSSRRTRRGPARPSRTPSISTSSAGDGSGSRPARRRAKRRMASSAASRISCWTASGSPPVSLSPMPRWRGRAVRRPPTSVARR